MGRKRFTIFTKITPEKVSNTKAKSPKAIIISVSILMSFTPSIMGAIDRPRSSVTRGERTSFAAEARLSSTPHSLRRLPNISMPTRAADSGAIREQMIVTAMGNMILVFLDTEEEE